MPEGAHLGFLHTDADHVELEPALEKLPLDLCGNTVESDVTTREDVRRSHDCTVRDGRNVC